MKRYAQVAVVLLSMLMTAMTWAGDLDVVLSPPDTPVQGGAALVVDLYLHNHTDAPISHELPLFLPCRIDMSQETVFCPGGTGGKRCGCACGNPRSGFCQSAVFPHPARIRRGTGSDCAGNSGRQPDNPPGGKSATRSVGGRAGSPGCGGHPGPVLCGRPLGPRTHVFSAGGGPRTGTEQVPVQLQNTGFSIQRGIWRKRRPGSRVFTWPTPSDPSGT
jgi:hypothetical protein